MDATSRGGLGQLQTLAQPRTRSLRPVARVERIAMITVHSSPVAMLGGKDAGGMNVYTRELARHMGSLDVDVDIFTRRTDALTPEIVELCDHVRVISVDAGPPAPVDKNELFSLLPEFSTEVALFSLRDGVRYDVIHSHYWLSGWAAHLLRRYWDAPIVHTFHTLAHLKNQIADEEHREPPLRVHVERRLLDLVDNVIAPNPDERAELVWRLGANNAHICVVPPGIDLDLFHPRDSELARARLGLPDGPLVLFVGRVDHVKGIDTLLDAFQALGQRDWNGDAPRLVFVGGTLVQSDNGPRLGPDLEQVAQCAARLGIAERILFRGSEPQDELPDYYSAATVCAVPSRYESFGLVAVEAMACGLPIVASRAGGLKFTVEEEISGLLVPPNDARALADALERVIKDRALRGSLQVGARQAAIRFSWQSIGPAMLHLYERLAEGDHDNLCCLGEVYAS